MLDVVVLATGAREGRIAGSAAETLDAERTGGVEGAEWALCAVWARRARDAGVATVSGELKCLNTIGFRYVPGAGTGT